MAGKDMTQQEFVDNIRQEIRLVGCATAVKLAAIIVTRSVDFKVNANPEEVLSMLPCEDIHIVEYATWLTKDYRRKDMYYFLPA